MILAMRSAVACKAVVESQDGGTDYLGVFGDELPALSRPGFVDFWIALHLDLDRRKTRGLVRIHAADYEYSFAYEVPEGWSVALIAFPVKAPVIVEGPIAADIYDEANQAHPFQATWSLAFAGNARVLDKAAAAEFVAVVRAARSVPSAAGVMKSMTRH